MATFESCLTIKHLDQPPLGPPCQSHVSVQAGQTSFIMSSPPLPTASNPRRRSRASQSSVEFSVPGTNAPELSNVPCYTCRRRHVKCDRILPHCAKCAKKGVACLGYRKPLRWADGVAVRGKLKGKSQPVIDGEEISIVRNNFQETFTSFQEEASHLVRATENAVDNIIMPTASQNRLELINYHNATMCANAMQPQYGLRDIRSIAPLTPETADQLPQDFVNCILTTAALHRAKRSPDDRRAEKIALEAKANLFHGINKLFQNPQGQRPDILFACVAIMFAMDIIEHGIRQINVHLKGAMNVIASSGGIDIMALHFPHMRITLAETLHFETMGSLLLWQAVESPKHASREALGNLVYDPVVRKSYFASCPLRLMQAIYDLRDCAGTIFQNRGIPSLADVYRREWILADILQFQPEEGTQNVKQTLCSNRSMSATEFQTWNHIFSAWRGAITIVVLRYLFFGLPNPDVPPVSRSPTPSRSDPHGSASLFGDPFDFLQDPELIDPELLEQDFGTQFQPPCHLAPGQYPMDPLSGDPSPIPSPRRSTESISLNFWSRRYDIHNEAFTDLFLSLTALTESPNPQYLRSALLPTMILGLVSRPDSPERVLCLTIFDMFKKSMANAAASLVQKAISSPVGGEELMLNVPWDKLDAYSKVVENEKNAGFIFVEDELRNSAPDWNWWHMLKLIDLQVVWPASIGTMHMEFGADFYAFGVMSGLVSDDCFAAFMPPPWLH